jgi:maltooligosyltrehalose trehalohydrolase
VSAPAATPRVGTPEHPVRRAVTFVYDAGPHPLSNLVLKGSWDLQTGRFSTEWTQSQIPLRALGDGRWSATVMLADDGQPHDWQWGVTADGPLGKGLWALMGEGNLHFRLDGTSAPTQSYAPTTYHRLGAVRENGSDAAFRFWAPNAKSVQVKVMAPSGEVERLPMRRSKTGDGIWTAQVKGGWARLEAKAYVYELVDSTGQLRERPDPYARVMQGEQRGIGRIYLDPATGKEGQAFNKDRLELMRFEVEGHDTAAEVVLVLKDASGKILDRSELEARVGAVDPLRISQMREGRFNDLWSEGIDTRGHIRMVNTGGAWSSLVPNPDSLNGLRYEFRVYDRAEDGRLRLRGDANGNGRLSAGERRQTPYNDDWSNVLSASSGKSWRASLIGAPAFSPAHLDAPRERDFHRWTVYQVHTGSIFGDQLNVKRSTFKDLCERLDYFKSLGANTLELLPTNEVEGGRDWGYIGMNSLAVESAYGFEDETGRWVTGFEALARFIDEAHARGLNVVNDVVYNHVGGDFNNLAQLDGPQDPYFNFAAEGSPVEYRDTDWGRKFAYTQRQVVQFIVDHANAQAEELGYDGLRFDFTEPIKNTGKPGWDLLREVNRGLHFFRPGFFTVAEQFDYDPSMTRPATPDGKGGGFDAQWYTQYQHDLVHEYDENRPGIVQAAAQDKPMDVERFMNTLTSPRGIESYAKAYTVISNHDEVGNAARTIRVAMNGKGGLPTQWARSIDKGVMALGLFTGGTPLMFQGEESMAQNTFKWGTPSTWDLGWSWLSLGKSWDWDRLHFTDAQVALYERLFALSASQRQATPEYQALVPADRQVVEDLAALDPSAREQALVDMARRFKFRLTQAALAFRQASATLSQGDMPRRVFVSQEDGVFAFSRHGDDGDYLVIANPGKATRSGYSLPLPEGRWREVFNTDAQKFGGSNVGNGGATVDGGGSRSLDLPAGGVLVFKKV